MVKKLLNFVSFCILTSNVFTISVKEFTKNDYKEPKHIIKLSASHESLPSFILVLARKMHVKQLAQPLYQSTISLLIDNKTFNYDSNEIFTDGKGNFYHYDLEAAIVRKIPEIHMLS